MKFGDLYQTAQSLGAQLATGHYAQVVNYQGLKSLARPKDSARDQTYPQGTLLNSNGKQLRKHSGVHHFTIGQRRGMGLAWANALISLTLTQTPELSR